MRTAGLTQPPSLRVAPDLPLDGGALFGLSLSQPARLIPRYARGLRALAIIAACT